MFDIPVVAGEGLFSQHETPPTSSVALINESMVKELGYARPEEALGAVLTSDDFEVKVIGVVKSFHQKSLRSNITPAVLLYAPRWTHHAGVEMRPQDIAKTLRLVEAVYRDVFPDTFFSYYFLDDYLHSLYEIEERVFSVLKVFALVAILIGCLGLYGLVSISAVQRMKEIGIQPNSRHGQNEPLAGYGRTQSGRNAGIFVEIKALPTVAPQRLSDNADEDEPATSE